MDNYCLVDQFDVWRGVCSGIDCDVCVSEYLKCDRVSKD